MREGYLRHRLLEWQEPVDDATLACLTKLGYIGEIYLPRHRTGGQVSNIQESS
jgi:hypothetical protein